MGSERLGNPGKIGELDAVGGGRGNGTAGSGPSPPGVGLLGVGLGEDGARLRPGAAVGVEA
jgi:hypothetical protein